MIALPERQELVDWIGQAHRAGARLGVACEEAGVSLRTYQRWHARDELGEDGRRCALRPPPAHALSVEERAQVLSTCHEPRFADLPPSQIVPRLADEGVYLASESTFYRILHDAKEQNHRGRAHARSKAPPQRHVACAPNAVWCWDVTYLPSQVRGMFFFLFAVIDLFSELGASFMNPSHPSSAVAARAPLPLQDTAPALDKVGSTQLRPTRALRHRAEQAAKAPPNLHGRRP
jgi:transposase InsO family protein